MSMQSGPDTQSDAPASAVTDAAEAWGRTLVIANPAAQSGHGERGAQEVARALSDGVAPTSDCELYLTQGAGDALHMVEQSGGSWDTVLALGGDGIVHEVVNGLMRLAVDQRPRMGVIPLGSGNDFARTAGMAARNLPVEALCELTSGGLEARERTFDVGRVASDAAPEGAWFIQTLSFGLDAAIALGSMETRKRSGARGTRLFGALGLDVFAHNREPFPYTATITGENGEQVELDDSEIVFAVQVGPTYGGGFRICPSASPTDGLLDLCRTTRVPSVPHTLALFARARLGLHAKSPVIALSRFSQMDVTFDREPPCQIDGEPLHGTCFHIETVPQALRVICGLKARW